MNFKIYQDLYNCSQDLWPVVGPCMDCDYGRGARNGGRQFNSVEVIKD